MSRQLSEYLELRAAGADITEASARSGIPLAEAKLTEKAIEKGEVEMPHVRAPAPAREDEQPEEIEMARDNESAKSTVAADELRLLIERIERLSEERKGIADDIADVYNEAKSRGYDKPTIRRIVRLRGMEAHERQEAAALLETYANAVGLQDALPL